MGARPGAGKLNERILLSLLETVDRGGEGSQRHFATEVGIALGLTNAYLRHCVNKGLVKVSSAPARRYVYYLTPRGFTEKSRLTFRYLSNSLWFFRQAKMQCLATFNVASARGFRQIALIGASDIAEIAVICAAESGVSIVAVADTASGRAHLAGIPIVPRISDLQGRIDAVVVTEIAKTAAMVLAARELYGENRVLVPEFLQNTGALSTLPVEEASDER